MRNVRWLVYKLGFRPKLGSIFHSPSASLIYAVRDAYKKGNPWNL